MKNLAQIEGNLGQDPTYAKLSSGREVTRFSVAVNKTWRKNGEKKTAVDWFKVEAWGYLAKPASRLKKADTVFVQGERRTGSYVKDNAKIPTQYTVAINLRKIDNSIYEKSEASEPAVPETEKSDELQDSNVPF